MKSLAPMCLTIVLTASTSLMAQPVHTGQSIQLNTALSLSIKTLNANLVRFSLDNGGSLGWPFYGAWSSALWWREGSWSFSVYDRGLWIVGKSDDKPITTPAMWGSVYEPGPIIDGKPALRVVPADSDRFRVYRISRGEDLSASDDYFDWPSDLGAPLDGKHRPVLKGDQTTWSIYNAADSAKTYWNGGFDRFPFEIHQTSYAWSAAAQDSENVLANTVIEEWIVINRSLATVDSAYLGLWADIDLNGAFSDNPGIDTLLQMAYSWCGRDSNFSWGVAGPAVGYLLLHGPAIPSALDTALFKGRRLPGYRNLPIASFWGFLDDYTGGHLFEPPYSSAAAWGVAKGLDNLGQVKINPTTNLPTPFSFSGDPVTGTGWICPWTSTGGGAGFMFFSGPFTLAPNDTQWIAAALTHARGRNRFESISKLRENARMLRSLPYNSLAGSGFTDEEIGRIPHDVLVFQNFPNPFNGSTTISYFLPRPMAVRLEIFNLVGQYIATVVDALQPANHYRIHVGAEGLPSGAYFYRLKAGDSVFLRKMVIVR